MENTAGNPITGHSYEGTPITSDVRDWYEHKTESILAKYGPGPRVHFHIGIVPPDADLPADRDGLRRCLVESQEALLIRAAEEWNASENLLAEDGTPGEVLDVGCGLGGPAIFWAERFGARVTGLTLAPSHASLVEQFAAALDLSDRVRPVVANANTWTSNRKFDAAIACESACYLQRDQWFRNLASLIRPGGHVLVEDTFLGHHEVKGLFDSYWHTRIGTVREYVDAAVNAGFRLAEENDLTAETNGFWRVSLEWIEATLRTDIDSDTSRRLQRSREFHWIFHRMWTRRDIQVRLLRFRRV